MANESKSGGQGSIQSKSGGKGSIPRPVLLGALGVVVAAVAGGIVVLRHPKAPTPIPSPQSGSAGVNSAAPHGTQAPRGSQPAPEVSGEPSGTGTSPASASPGRQQNVATSAHHRAHGTGRASAEAARRDQDVPSKRVSLADLDLSTHTGACAALRRIKLAAEEVCPDTDERQLYLRHVRQECLQESIARAVRDTHSGQLQALYGKRPRGC